MCFNERRYCYFVMIWWDIVNVGVWKVCGVVGCRSGLYVAERGMICWKGFLCERKSGWLFKKRVVEVRWSSILAVLFFVNIQAYIQISVARDSIKMQIYRVTKGGHLHLSKTFVKLRSDFPDCSVFINSKHIAGTRVATELLMGDFDSAYFNPTTYLKLIGFILKRADILSRAD